MIPPCRFNMHGRPELRVPLPQRPGAIDTYSKVYSTKPLGE